MVSVLDFGQNDPGSSLSQVTVLCFQARNFTLTVPLQIFTQVYKWVPANLLLGVTVQWTSIPSRGGGGSRNTPSRATETGISCGLMGLLAGMQTLPYHLHCTYQIWPTKCSLVEPLLIDTSQFLEQENLRGPSVIRCGTNKEFHVYLA